MFSRFNPQRGGYKPKCTPVIYPGSYSFNPQRGGYKHVGKLDFIISTLCNGVNVFISVHHIKILHSSEKSSSKVSSILSVYPATASNYFKVCGIGTETEYKINLKKYPPEVDGNDF